MTILNRSAKSCDRLIDPMEETTYRVFLFRPDLSPDKERHKHRCKGNGKKGGKEHGKGLCIGEWCEKPSCLGLQGKDREEIQR